MPNLYTPDFIYRTAKEYFRIGTVATGYFVKNLIEDPYSYAKIQAPAVNISFALELSIKAILLHELGRVPRGHEFLKLHKLLSPEAKEKIAAYFGKTIALGGDFPIIRYKKAQSDHEPNTHDCSTVAGVLAMHQDAFIEWRYAHEFSIKEPTIMDFNFSAMVRVTSSCFQYIENDVIPITSIR